MRLSRQNHMKANGDRRLCDRCRHNCQCKVSGVSLSSQIVSLWSYQRSNCVNYAYPLRAHQHIINHIWMRADGCNIVIDDTDNSFLLCCCLIPISFTLGRHRHRWVLSSVIASDRPGFCLSVCMLCNDVSHWLRANPESALCLTLSDASCRGKPIAPSLQSIVTKSMRPWYSNVNSYIGVKPSDTICNIATLLVCAQSQLNVFDWSPVNFITSINRGNIPHFKGISSLWDELTSWLLTIPRICSSYQG